MFSYLFCQQHSTLKVKKKHIQMFCNHCCNASGPRKLINKGDMYTCRAEEKPKTWNMGGRVGRVMCYDWTLTTLALTRLPLLFPPTPGHHINHCLLYLKYTAKKHQNQQKLSGELPADFMCFDWRPWAGSFRHLLGRGHPLNPLLGRVRSGCTALLTTAVHCLNSLN